MTYPFNFKTKGHAAAAVTAALILGSAGTVIAEDMHNMDMHAGQEIVGTWMLTAADKLLPDGTRVADYGMSPHGLVIFTADGHYSLQIYRSDRPKFASGDKSSGTPDEYKTAFVGMSVSYGRYEIDPVKHTITFHREGNALPNLEGTTGADPYELKGDMLSWKVAARPDGAIPITVLQRVKPMT